MLTKRRALLASRFGHRETESCVLGVRLRARQLRPDDTGHVGRAPTKRETGQSARGHFSILIWTCVGGLAHASVRALLARLYMCVGVCRG